MAVSKIKSTLPKGDYLNGLDDIAQALADAPHRKRVVVMLVDCGRVQLDHPEDGDDDLPPGVTATARIRAAEALDGIDADLARRLLVRARERRHGRYALPLDTEAGLLGVDPATGEKLGGDGSVSGDTR